MGDVDDDLDHNSDGDGAVVVVGVAVVDIVVAAGNMQGDTIVVVFPLKTLQRTCSFAAAEGFSFCDLFRPFYRLI